jgi:alkylation response protein AidB-like acyl-CoA dehydrogenase
MWNLLINEDEAMIARSVREYLASELPIERLRPKAATTDIAQVSAGMYELGCFGVGLPEATGGAGLGLVEEMLVQRECGRFLVSPVELASVLAAHVAVQVGDDALARDLTIGTVRAALAIPVFANVASASIEVQTFDLQPNNVILLWNEQGMGLFNANAITNLSVDECIDESVRMHSGSLTLANSRHWLEANATSLPQRAQVLLAAACVGLAEHACDLTVEYAKVRKQFGQPIGTFQAVKHRCADMGARWRLAWYQTCLAALQVQTGVAEAALNAASAKLLAAQAAHENGRAAIQMHGGIGFQSECDAHWFMKRAHLYDQIGGAVRAQARRVVAEPTWIA